MDEMKPIYFDIEDEKEKLKLFNIFLGGRGIGKTFSVIKKMISDDTPFIFLRTQKTTLDEVFKKAGADPFAPVFRTLGIEYHVRKSGEKYIIESPDRTKEYGFAGALSTFRRGADYTNYDAIIYDEFIEEKGDPFNTADALFSVYETVNRNREIEGKEPVKVYLLSNTRRPSSHILASFKLIDRCIQMTEKAEEEGKTQRFTRGDLYLCVPYSTISEAKAQSRFYKMIEGTDYYDEAIQNSFRIDEKRIKKVNIQEYIPILSVGNLFIYRHKSRREAFVTRIKHTGGDRYEESEARVFFQVYGWELMQYEIQRALYFDNPGTEIYYESLRKL